MTTTLRVLLLVGALVTLRFPLLAADSIDLDSATIADLNAAFNAGTLTAEKLVQLCLARIEAYDRQGPVAARRHHAQPESARDRPRARRRTQGQGSAVATARHPDRPQGQLRHVRPADDRRLGPARRVDSARRCVRRQEAARRPARSSSPRSTSPSSRRAPPTARSAARP